MTDTGRAMALIRVIQGSRKKSSTMKVARTAPSTRSSLTESIEPLIKVELSETMSILVPAGSWLLSLSRLLRTSSDTFGVLLPEASQREANAACGRVIEAMGEMGATAVGGHRFSASAGVAPFVRSADRTLREAELALLAAKAHGRARVENARCA